MGGQDREEMWGRTANPEGLLEKPCGNLLLWKHPKIYTKVKEFKWGYLMEV